MSAAAYASKGVNWFSRAEACIDEKGKGAWIALMVLGFVFFWPVGLAILLYITFSKNIWKKSGAPTVSNTAFNKSSGNAVFDKYRTDTLHRLGEEQKAFGQFMKNLREAEDQAEFDQFMDAHSSK